MVMVAPAIATVGVNTRDAACAIVLWADTRSVYRAW